ncbi:MAG: type I secretion system permease/ATPase, partial [Selenomonadaceae bacterium]|nr:type I secretion system permease/ATPase [Selenomonadaceae bacterium]
MPEEQGNMIENRTGLISIVKILQHFGAKDLQEILDKNPETDDQLDWKRLQKIASKYNVKGNVIRPTIDELREIEYPAIAKMTDGAYVTIGSANDEVVLMLDPREKKPTAMAVKQFLESWTNELLVFSAALSWTYFKKRYNVDWFLLVLKRYKKPLFEVLCASFFLQLMGIGMPLITQVIIDKVIGNNGMSTLTVIGTSMCVFFFMQSLLTLIKTYLLNHTTNKLDAILGTRLFRHLIALPLPYYERRRVGDTLMRVGALTQIREFLTGSGLMTVLDVFFSIVFIAFMFWYSVPLTLIALLTIPLYLVQNIWAVPIIKRKIEAVWRTGATNNAFMVESITNIETIKALAVEPQFTNKWENLLARYVRTTFENIKFRLVIGAFSGIVQVSISMAILWYGGHMVMDGLFTLGQLIAFQMISKQALDPMTKLLTMWPQVQQVGLSLERIGDILNTGMEPIVKEM